MIVLALDTTTRAGSSAVLRDQVILAELAGDGALTHGERLPEELMRALTAASLSIDDVELFAVAAGPGSFTGLRVGIATMQGLAMARGRTVVPVSALEALARAAVNPTTRIAACMDAQRGEVFAELYAPDGRQVLAAAQSLPPRALGDLYRAEGSAPVFIGDGAVRYREDLVATFGAATRVLPPLPLAGLIGQIAAAHPERAVRPHAVIPIYVRKPDAELARDRRAPVP